MPGIQRPQKALFPYSNLEDLFFLGSTPLAEVDSSVGKGT